MKYALCALLSMTAWLVHASDDCDAAEALADLYHQAERRAPGSDPVRAVKKRRQGHVSVAYVVTLSEAFSPERHAKLLQEIERAAPLLQRDSAKLCEAVNAIRQKYDLYGDPAR